MAACLGDLIYSSSFGGGILYGLIHPDKLDEVKYCLSKSQNTIQDVLQKDFSDNLEKS